MAGPYIDPKDAKDFEKGVLSGGPSWAQAIQNLKEGLSGPTPEELDRQRAAQAAAEAKKQALIRMMTGPGRY